MLASAPHGAPASNSHAAFQRIRSAASSAHMRSRDRELDALVGADRAAEDARARRVAACLSMNQRPSPMHSAAIRIRSAFMPSRM